MRCDAVSAHPTRWKYAIFVSRIAPTEPGPKRHTASGKRWNIWVMAQNSEYRGKQVERSSGSSWIVAGAVDKVDVTNVGFSDHWGTKVMQFHRQRPCPGPCIAPSGALAYVVCRTVAHWSIRSVQTSLNRRLCPGMAEPNITPPVSS